METDTNHFQRRKTWKLVVSEEGTWWLQGRGGREIYDMPFPMSYIFKIIICK